MLLTIHSRGKTDWLQGDTAELFGRPDNPRVTDPRATANGLNDMENLTTPVLAAGLLASALCAAKPHPSARAFFGDMPRYDSVGRLLVPQNYREWVFLSSGLHMRYDKAHLRRPTMSSITSLFHKRYIALSRRPEHGRTAQS
jgi:hypothetical protein